MTHFHHAAIVSALLASVGAVNAQTTVITREPVGSRTVVTTEPLQLTPVQRQTIYRTIVRERVRRHGRLWNTVSARGYRKAFSSTLFRMKLQSRCLPSGPTNTWW